MRVVLNVLMVLALAALNQCKSSAPSVQTATPAPPSWVVQKPNFGDSYVGVGSALKSMHTNYQEAAKKQALTDLASEISVQISGSSSLFALESLGTLKETYNQYILTETNADLSGFELGGTYEDATSYYTYYTLNKAVYAEQQAAKRTAAFQRASSHLEAGAAAKQAKNFNLAAQQFVQALNIVSGYWNNDQEVNTSLGSVYLVDYVYRQLIQLVGSAELKVPASVVLEASNGYQPTVDIQVTTAGEPWNGIPISFQYFGSERLVAEKLYTQSNGNATLKLARADVRNSANRLELKLTLDELWKGFPLEVPTAQLVKDIPVPKKILPIEVKAPVLYLEVEELNFGKPISPAVIQPAMANALRARGFSVVNSPSGADYAIAARATTEQGSGYEGFKVAWLNLECDLKDIRSGEVLLHHQPNRTKGVDLTYQNAGEKAFAAGANQEINPLVRRLESAIYGQ